MGIFLTLTGKDLSQLPAMPTNVRGMNDDSGTTISWVNNNTFSGCTNIVQLFENNVWVDKVEVASGETEAYITGYTGVTGYTINTRVAVYQTGTTRYYSSQLIVFQYGTGSAYPQNGLLARWSFDDDDLTDTSGNGYTAQIDGSYSFVTGLVGNCLRKENNCSFYTDILAIRQQTGMQNPCSFGGWFKASNASQGDGRTGADQTGYVVAEDNGYIGWRYEGNPSEWVVMERGSGRNYTDITSIVSGGMQNDVWYHWFVCYDSVAQTQTYYLNGEVAWQQTSATTNLSTKNYFIIQDRYAQTYSYIDNFYIYDRALSVEEVQLLYNSGAGV